MEDGKPRGCARPALDPKSFRYGYGAHPARARQIRPTAFNPSCRPKRLSVVIILSVLAGGCLSNRPCRNGMCRAGATIFSLSIELARARMGAVRDDLSWVKRSRRSPRPCRVPTAIRGLPTVKVQKHAARLGAAARALGPPSRSRARPTVALARADAFPSTPDHWRLQTFPAATARLGTAPVAGSERPGRHCAPQRKSTLGGRWMRPRCAVSGSAPYGRPSAMR